MVNPFDDPDGTFLVLVNDELQYSLWPAFVRVPDGWTVALAAGSREEAVEFVDRTWTDMRPKSLVDAMAEQ
ncbi:MbtH family protein [Streptomyces olivaceoviridis]|uniref:MbtH family protein n=1 Tax=Streptomyces olivaceoviridis TaxID=1921 RepID=UPI003702F08B